MGAAQTMAPYFMPQAYGMMAPQQQGQQQQQQSGPPQFPMVGSGNTQAQQVGPGGGTIVSSQRPQTGYDQYLALLRQFAQR
jgi:hypothetical protein